jgi:DNA polymerase III alpha subunit (gram-positive type)
MNNIKDRNYFALDLELNNHETPKIIQVGIAVGSPIKSDQIKTYSWFLDPLEPITPFITQLTGITDETIREKSVSHEVVAQELGSIITENCCFTNPITWGQGDSLELLAEFKERSINFPFFGRRIFDVKTLYVFHQMVKGLTVSGGLKRVMNSYKLEFEGDAHRADVDSLNTLRLFFHLIHKGRKLQDTLTTLTAL